MSVDTFIDELVASASVVNRRAGGYMDLCRVGCQVVCIDLYRPAGGHVFYIDLYRRAGGQVVDKVIWTCLGLF